MACGLSLVVHMRVHTGFIVFVGGFSLLPRPPVVLWPVVWTLWFTCGLWRVYRGFLTVCTVFITVHTKFQESYRRGMACKKIEMRTKPVIVNIFKLRQRYEVSKAMTFVRTAIRTTLIPVTVGTFAT